MEKSDIGLVGIAVMGENLVMNIESRGFAVSVYNRTADKVAKFLETRAKGKRIRGAGSLAELVGQLKKPRIVMLMVKAGQPVDDCIEQLLPLLEAGDIILDGGNSHYPDTERRVAYAEGKGLLYIGAGVSGGEEGALKGPSIMPGGSPAAWEHVKPILQAIAAKSPDGSPCCEWVGNGGAGHFVKMVHNGIEYGDMQIICEAYHLMRDGFGMNAGEMCSEFRAWNRGELNSYLIEITGDILAYQDDGGNPLVDKILDSAGQKGTGKWTVFSALDAGVPLTLIGEAVFSRCLSAAKDERVRAADLLRGPEKRIAGEKREWLDKLRKALLASKIMSYSQGYALMRAVSLQRDWALNYGGIALMWRGGCIIRSAFLGEIKRAFDQNPAMDNLLMDGYFRDTVHTCQAAWRDICAAAIQAGIPAPAMSSALAYYDGYRCKRLPANLLQAQRDYFGAHTYQRTDAPPDQYFHTNWTGEGGGTASSVYIV